MSGSTSAIGLIRAYARELAAGADEARLDAMRGNLTTLAFARILDVELQAIPMAAPVRKALTDLRVAAGDGAAGATSTLKISELLGVNASASLFVGAVVAAVQPGVSYIWLVPALAAVLVAILTAFNYRRDARLERLLRSIEQEVTRLQARADRGA